jgi:hypothetical protein
MFPATDPRDPPGRRIAAGAAGPASDAPDGRERPARAGPAHISTAGDAKGDDALAPDHY